MQQSQKRLLSWCILLILPILGCFFAIQFSLSFPVNVVLIYLTPALFLTFARKQWWQSLQHAVFALLVPLPFAIIVDYIGISSKLWYTVNTGFPWRIFGVIPLEDLFWMAAGVYTICTLGAYLQKEETHNLFTKKLLSFAVIAVFALAAFFVFAQWRSEIFVWQSKYTYLVLGSTFALLPAMILLFNFRRAFAKALPLLVYFMFLTVMLENTEAFLGHWTFPGNYLLTPPAFLGSPGVPYEEYFFVGIVEVLVAVGFYAFFTSKPVRRA